MIEYISLTIVAVSAIGALVWMYYLTLKERAKLLSRIMARTYQEYEYHDKMYKEDIKEAKKLRNESRKIKKEEDEIDKEMDIEFRREKDMLSNMDEDWEEEEVDLEKFREKTASKAGELSESGEQPIKE